MRPEETGLIAARDDGRISYLEFAAAADGIQVHDHDGRPLTAVAAGRVVAVAGLHPGLLVRHGDRASFVAPNPRAGTAPASGLTASADHVEARARLEQQWQLSEAMQRALVGSRIPAAPDRGPGGASAALPPPLPASSPTAQTPTPLLSDIAPAPVPALRGGGASFPAVPPRPLAVANAAAVVPEQGLIRVFFASASRAIVAPEDGLALLLAEAMRADAIRVTGYTDATGSIETNEALALARADAVVRILLRRGVPPDRITRAALAATAFIADNLSDRGRALNRRVEVVLSRQGRPMMLGSGPPALR